MSHAEQQRFCLRVRERFPHWFEYRKVLDCGSLDINGNNRYLFTACQYTGIDILPGPNVDKVSRIHEHQGGPYATIICTEALEHDQHFALSMQRMIDLLTPDGPLIITCATTGRPEHGTTLEEPWSSPGTLGHYRNIPAGEMADILDAAFRCWSVEKIHSDLYAWGVDKRI